MVKIYTPITFRCLDYHYLSIVRSTSFFFKRRNSYKVKVARGQTLSEGREFMAARDLEREKIRLHKAPPGKRYLNSEMQVVGEHCCTPNHSKGCSIFAIESSLTCS